MKRILGFAAAVLVVAGASTATAQFKTQAAQEARIQDGSIRPTDSPMFLFGWFDPSKFHMSQMVDFSYTSAGGQGYSLGTYTNSMMYQFSDKLDARADISMSYSPFNTFGKLGGKNNSLSSLYLSRAQLDYKPWQNFLVQVQYRQIPYGNYYSPFYSPWYREDGF